jgi:hypothetical protein
MERLVTTSEAASILGISVQGVHYRIKNGKLRSKKVDGKAMVFLDEPDTSKETSLNDTTLPTQTKLIEELTKTKDEHIEFLKNMVRWMRKYHDSEVKRLEKHHRATVEALHGEVKVIKQAFNELKDVYKPKKESDELEYKESASSVMSKSDIREETHNTKEAYSSDGTISIKRFHALMKLHGKTDSQVKLIIMDAIESGDGRFSYDKELKKLSIIDTDFSDLI